MRDSEISRIAELFALASVDPGGWHTALEALAHGTGSARGQLIGLGPQELIGFNLVTDTDPALLERFDEIDGADPAVNFRIAASLGSTPGELIHEAHYDRVRGALRSDDYDAFCDEFDIPYGCQTILTEDRNAVIGLAVLRTQAEGPTTATQREVFERLIPHVRAAVRTHTMLGRRGAELMLGALEAVSTATILIDPYGQVIGVTPAAEEILSSTRHAVIARGRFRPTNPIEQRAFDEAMRRVLVDATPDQHILLRLASELPMRVSIQRLPEQDWNFGFRPRAAIMLRTRALLSDRVRLTLEEQYGLTAAEADIAQQLHAGLPRATIASRRGVSLGTVRQQVKASFAKLGVHREADLIALIAAISDE